MSGDVLGGYTLPISSSDKFPSVENEKKEITINLEQSKRVTVKLNIEVFWRKLEENEQVNVKGLNTE